MKMVKSLLLGSAAALVAASGVQAADLPVKAKPVEYVKVCSLYGAAYYYVPGTNTCFKLGVNIQIVQGIESSGGKRIYRNGSDARYTRADSAFTSWRVTAQLFLDWRTQTEYGTLRAYMTPQVEYQSPTSDDTASVDRAYIQWAGWTIGVASSALDLLSYSQFAAVSTDQGTSASANGTFSLRYTAEFGNGLSSSFGFEDSCLNSHGSNACSQHGRARVVSNLNPGTINFNNGGTVTVDNGPGQWPDIVANLRLDQAWGTIQVAGGVKQLNGSYFFANPGGSGANCSHTTTCGSPADKWGWTANIQFLLKDVFGFKGDTFGFSFSVGEGSGAESSKSARAWSAFTSDSNQALALYADAFFANPGSALAPAGYDGSLQLTKMWSILTGYNHVWNANWQTSVYGGWGVTTYNSTAQAMICNSIANTAGTGSTFSGATTSGAGFSCGDGPNFAAGEIGTRTKWIPTNYLEFQLDVQWHKIQTAFKNGFISYTALSGARPSGRYNFSDSDRILVVLRADYKFFD